MDNNTERFERPTLQQPTRVPERSSKPKKGAKTLMLALLILVLIAAGAGAYWWRDKEAKAQAKKQTEEIAQVKRQLHEAKAEMEVAEIDEGERNAEDSPAAANEENIKDSIKSGNTAALEGYMASTVRVIIAASEGVGNRTPTQAINDLKYLDSATDPWNFALSTDTLNEYANGDYAQYFPLGAVVGKSADDKVVSFTFNSSGKINGIFMAVNADLL